MTYRAHLRMTDRGIRVPAILSLSAAWIKSTSKLLADETKISVFGIGVFERTALRVWPAEYRHLNNPIGFGVDRFHAPSAGIVSTFVDLSDQIDAPHFILLSVQVWVHADKTNEPGSFPSSNRMVRLAKSATKGWNGC